MSKRKAANMTDSPFNVLSAEERHQLNGVIDIIICPTCGKKFDLTENSCSVIHCRSRHKLADLLPMTTRLILSTPLTDDKGDAVDELFRQELGGFINAPDELSAHALLLLYSELREGESSTN